MLNLLNQYQNGGIFFMIKKTEKERLILLLLKNWKKICVVIFCLGITIPGFTCQTKWFGCQKTPLKSPIKKQKPLNSLEKINDKIIKDENKK